MEQKQLKTTWQTRLVVGIIAFLMLFSTVAVYALIVLSNEKQKKTNASATAELTKVEKELSAAKEELTKDSEELSKKHYETLSKYRSKAKSYNAKAVDDAGLKTEDLVVGNGPEITKDSSYYGYYIGWCADESVFDSSFDNFENPKSLKSPLEYEAGKTNLIAGWSEGVIGMKVGGVREISIPGALAYGETREICGGKNSPLKFVVYTIDPGEDFKNKIKKYNELYQQYTVLYYSQRQDLINSK